MYNLSPSQYSAVSQVARTIGARTQDLIDLISFESGWNPLAKNPSSGARGLIQFIPSTAKALGFKDADDLVNKHPSVESQLLGPVTAYLRKWSPYPTFQSLAMSIFFPIARTVPSDTTFATLYKKAYPNSHAKLYPIFKKQNPGIDTVNDYLSMVMRKAQGKPVKAVNKSSNINSIASLALALNAVVWYFVIRR